MKQSTNHILTTHVGSLPRPADLLDLYRNQAPAEQLKPRLAGGISAISRRRSQAGTWKTRS
jgi:methionine synthase II (cobalamin-independent)